MQTSRFRKLRTFNIPLHHGWLKVTYRLRPFTIAFYAIEQPADTSPKDFYAIDINSSIQSRFGVDAMQAQVIEAMAREILEPTGAVELANVSVQTGKLPHHALKSNRLN